MKREWKPGDVALRVSVTGKHVAVRVSRCTASTSSTADRPHWHFASESPGVVAQCGTDDMAEYRPLVVIDPEDDEQVERLDRAVDKALGESPKYTSTTECMQIALRSLLPAKPDEPTGLGAVVEDAEGRVYVRVRDVENQWAGRDGHWRTWPHIAAVKILSGGVQ